ncbi:MAG: sulfatase-like hydrolase/transferase [bacterium]|nr:sulfatase-like hydrolase/transferase [bacterium]
MSRHRHPNLVSPDRPGVDRRDFLKSAVLGVGSLALSCAPTGRKAPVRPPNVVLIMADDMGVEALGCYGGTSYETPFLDRLAATGVRFGHCYSQPVCTPSRIKIMTGRYNHRNYAGFGKLDENEVTFGNVLRQAGYATGIGGKWQLGADRELISQFGFDEYCLWWLENKSPRYGNVGELIRNGEVLPGGKGEYGPDVISGFLIDFIEQHRERPFFCYYPMLLPHDPFEATPRSAPEAEDRAALFGDMVVYLDEIVGRIVAKLDEAGLRDDTLILFTSDNGTSPKITSSTTSGEVRGGKYRMTDTGTHVPLIANWRGFSPPGAVCDDLVDFSDFLPTLAEATGAEPPADRVIDGRSFLPQVRGQAGKPREWVFCHYPRRRDDPEKTRAYIRDKRWKLYDNGKMYDLSVDPLERSPFREGHREDSDAARIARARLQRAYEGVVSSQDS